MKYRVFLSFIFIFFISLFAKSQSTLEKLRSVPVPKYIIVYSERFIKDDNKSGYYFVIDEGYKSIQNTLDSIKGNMVITDSAFYLKDNKGITVSFESPLAFLNYMSLHGWDLICNQDLGIAVVMKANPAKEIYSFLLRRNVK